MQEMQETPVLSLGQEDPLMEEMATHSSVLAWKMPWTEEPGGLQAVGSQRAGHDWAHTTSFGKPLSVKPPSSSVYLSTSPLASISFFTFVLDFSIDFSFLKYTGNHETECFLGPNEKIDLLFINISKIFLMYDGLISNWHLGREERDIGRMAGLIKIVIGPSPDSWTVIPYKYEYCSHKILKLFSERIACAQGKRWKRVPNSCELSGKSSFRRIVSEGPQCAWLACAQFLDWLASRWSFRYHQPSDFKCSGVYMLAVSRFHLKGVFLL